MPLADAGAFLTRDEIHRLRTRSNVRGALLVLHAWAVIALALAAFALWPNPVTLVLGVMVVGGRQLGLAILMHDAAHGLLFRRRAINDWVGRWLCGAPAIASMDLYRPYHLTHHRLTQQPEDPDLGLSAPFPITRASLRRKMVRDLTGRTAYQRRRLQLRDALGSPAWPWRRRLARALDRIGGGVLVNAVLFATLAALGYWYLYVALWLLPLATWYQLVSRIRNIAEHAVVPDNDDPLRNTRTTRAGWLERAFVAPYFVNYHLEHHLFLFVPCWRLPETHRLLVGKGLAPRMEIQRGYRAVLRAATSAATAAVLAAVLLACGAGPAAAADPVKIGFIGPLTGIFAPAGKDMAEGIKMAFEQAGYQAGRRKLELIEEDSEGNPATAQAKYRKLVSQDKIHALAGVLLSNIGYALVPPIERDRIPSLFLTTPDDLTKRRPAKYVLRSNFAASQPMHALGDYAAKTLKYKRVVAIAMDNPFGHEGIGGFQRVFEDSGGKVLQKIWVPLNVMDFAPFLSQVPRDADAVVQVFVAGQAVRFAKHYGESPLQGRVPLIGSGVFTDQSSLVGMGDEVIGHVGALIWAPTLNNPANRTFMQLAEEKLKRTPSYFHAVMYSSGRWIIEAVKALDGNVDDRDKLLAAIRKASETTPDPRGPIKLDEYNNPTENVYIVKVEKVGGKLQNTVVHVYPMVSQFWTYKPDDFLKTPAYDRGYPPVKP